MLVARWQQRSCCPDPAPYRIFACTIQANKLHLYAPVRTNSGTYFDTAASRFPVAQRCKASDNSVVSLRRWFYSSLPFFLIFLHSFHCMHLLHPRLGRRPCFGRRGAFWGTRCFGELLPPPKIYIFLAHCMEVLIRLQFLTFFLQLS